MTLTVAPQIYLDGWGNVRGGRLYRFAWSSFCGYPLQIPKNATVELITTGKRRSVLVRYGPKLFITDRYALRKIPIIDAKREEKPHDRRR